MVKNPMVEPIKNNHNFRETKSSPNLEGFLGPILFLTVLYFDAELQNMFKVLFFGGAKGRFFEIYIYTWNPNDLYF